MYKDFLVYKSGLYQVLDGAMKFNSGHAIKIIGWDVLNGKNHWIIEKFLFFLNIILIFSKFFR